MQMTKETVATGNNKGHHNAIANFYVGNLTSRFDHCTHKFVTKYITVIGTGNFSAIKM
jgi:hypothetical protein